jgi:chromosome segregation ATPase
MSDAKGDLGFCTTDCKYIDDVEGWRCETHKCYKKDLIRVKFQDSDRIVGIPLKDGVTVNNDKDPVEFSGAGITTDNLNDDKISGGLLPKGYRITVTKDDHKMDVTLEGKKESILEIIKKLEADIVAAKAAAVAPGGAPPSDIAKLQAEIANIQADLTTANAEKVKALQDFNALQIAKGASNASGAAAQAAFDQAQRDLAARDARITDLQTRLDEAINNLTNEIARLNSDLANARYEWGYWHAAAEERDRIIALLKGVKGSIDQQEEIDQLRADFSKSQDDYYKLYLDYETLAKASATLMEQYDKQVEELGLKNQQVEELETRINFYETENEQIRSDLGRGRITSAAEKEQLEAEIERNNAEITELKENLTYFQGIVRDLSVEVQKRNERINEVTIQLDALAKKLRDTEHQLEEATKKIAQINDAAHTALDIMNTNVKKAEQAAIEARTMAYHARSQLETALADLAAANKRKTEAEAALTVAGTRKNEAEVALAAATAAASAAEKRASDAEERAKVATDREAAAREAAEQVLADAEKRANAADAAKKLAETATADMEKRLAAAEAKIRGTEEQLADVTNALALKETEMGQAAAAVAKAQGEITQLEEELAAARTKSGSNAATIKELEARLNAARSEAEMRENELADIRREKHKLDLAQQRLSGETDRLNKTIEELQSQVDGNRDLSNSTINKLRESLLAAEADAISARSQVQSANKKAADAEARAQAAQQKANEAEAKLQALRKAVENTAKTTNEANLEFRKRMEDLEKKKAETELAAETANKEANDARAEATLATDRAITADKELAAIRVQLAALERQKKDSDDRAASCEGALRKCEKEQTAAAERVAALEQAIAKARETAEAALASAATAEQKAAAATSRANASNAAAMNAKAKADNATNKSTKDAEAAVVAAEMAKQSAEAAAKAAIEEASKAKQDAIEAATSVKSLEGEAQAARDRAAAATQDLEAMRKQLETLKASDAANKKRADDCDTTLAELRAERTKLQQDLETAQTTAAAATTRANASNASKKATEEEKAAANSEKAAAEKTIETLQTQLADMAATIKIKEEITKTSNELATAFLELQGRYKDALSKIDDKDKETKAALTEVAAVKEALAAANAETIKVTNELNTVKPLLNIANTTIIDIYLTLFAIVMPTTKVPRKREDILPTLINGAGYDNFINTSMKPLFTSCSPRIMPSSAAAASSIQQQALAKTAELELFATKLRNLADYINKSPSAPATPIPTDKGTGTTRILDSIASYLNMPPWHKASGGNFSKTRRSRQTKLRRTSRKSKS